MAAVVTGAAGFIGRRLVEELARLGPVIGIDRNDATVTPRGATHVVAELLEPRPDVAEVLGSADVVFHLAGCGDVRDARPDADLHRYRDNGLATAAVLAATPVDAPVFVASSSSVYGGSRNGRTCVETRRAQPAGRLRPQQSAGRADLCWPRGRRRAGDSVPALHRCGRGSTARHGPLSVDQGGPGKAAIAPARFPRPHPRHHRRRQMATALIDLAAADRAGRRVGTVNIGTGHALKLGELSPRSAGCWTCQSRSSRYPPTRSRSSTRWPTPRCSSDNRLGPPDRPGRPRRPPGRGGSGDRSQPDLASLIPTV